MTFPFEAARILLALRRPREAVTFNEHSLWLFGDHPVTFGNMGICYYHAEQLEASLRSFDRACSSIPTMGCRALWRARVLAELRSQVAAPPGSTRLVSTSQSVADQSRRLSALALGLAVFATTAA